MVQYIDKDALAAEIKRKIHNIDYEGLSDRNIGQKQSLYHILSFLDTLKVKEIDLENMAVVEWDNYVRSIDGEPDNAYMLIERSQYINLAKHFFELGLKLRRE